jgi:hypothetical protein
MDTKLSQLKSAAANGNWQKAISIAAKFPQLGSIRNEVLDAHMAYTNPRFAKQIGKDIDACIDAGRLALIAAYRIEH